MKAYLAQIRMNLRLTMRDRMVLFFSYLFPLFFFFMFGQMSHAANSGAGSQVVISVLTIGVLGSGLLGAGIRAVAEREQNILRRFKVAPINAGPILVSSLVTGLVNYLPVVVIVLVLARTLYGMAPVDHQLSLFVFLSIGILAFRAIGGMVAAVVNSMQESQIVIQILYLTMLMLGGATIPLSIMPEWLQTVAQFLPSTHFYTGMQGILLKHETIFDNLPAVGSLALTTLLATFLGVKLFRWEKEEKVKAAAKLWLLAVLAPFLFMGVWQAHAKTNIHKEKILAREMSRKRTLLIRDARLFLGNGAVIEQGAVLIKDGKIARIFSGAAPDPKTLNADPIEGAGKTLLPGLIDVHVHLGANGGLSQDPKQYADMDANIDRELAAYLYSGVTAVKSAGDALDLALEHRATIASGEKLGAELFAVGPLFTAAGGHGTEILKFLPESIRANAESQFLRLPKTTEEARAQVAELRQRGVDGIKAVVEAGAGSIHFNRIDLAILHAIGDAARQAGLPLVCHTGEARDIADALDAGANGIEHGSFRDAVPAALFERMKQMGVTYDPTLTVVEAIQALAQGNTATIDRSLVAQTAPPALLADTRQMLSSGAAQAARAAFSGYPLRMDLAKQNLAAAYRAGVILVTGTDAGNPLALHGPGVHRELQLWVEAGIPPAVALQGATYNAARLLRADGRIGLLHEGYDASLLLVDGNPLQDISATERISGVFFKGEHIDRSELFENK